MHFFNKFLLLLVVKVHVPLGQPGLARPVLDHDEPDHPGSQSTTENKILFKKGKFGKTVGFEVIVFRDTNITKPSNIVAPVLSPALIIQRGQSTSFSSKFLSQILKILKFLKLSLCRYSRPLQAPQGWTFSQAGRGEWWKQFRKSRFADINCRDQCIFFFSKAIHIFPRFNCKNTQPDVEGL